MQDPLSEPIIKRLHKLNDAISSCGIESPGVGSLSPKYFLAKDGLLDALLALYDECNNDTLKKNSYISKFIEKYRSTILELKTLRVNLNDFEQKRVIGKGHFGVVKVVREKQTGNVYALKILQKAETLAQQHVTFYEEERDIMAKATSPWITHLQFAFQDEQNLYLLMDFHPGGDLLSLLDRFNYIFSEEMARFYIAEIAVAIQAIHSMGYVHRDVKPENILIDRLGHIKLADFGYAAKLTASKFVRSEMPVGTPDYIAPELLTSMNRTNCSDYSYGVECDFWSLGIMAYEMVYGETPFKGDTAVVTYSNIMNYEKTLKFHDTDENEVSDSAKDLIRCLLSSAEQRLSYSSIIKHKFFLHIDWNNLEAVQPPFIPVITSVDDTSNFEEFEYKESAPSIESFRTKQSFSGFQLPFVGFTYTRSFNTENSKNECSRSLLNSTLNSSTMVEQKESSHLQAELKAKKKELHEANLKIQRLTSGDQNKPLISQIEARAIKAEKRVSLMQDDVDGLRKENFKYSKLIEKLKETVNSEKALQQDLKKKTLEKLKEYKTKFEETHENKKRELKYELEIYRNSCITFQNEKDEYNKQLADMSEKANNLEREAVKYKHLLKLKIKELNTLTIEKEDSSSEKTNTEDFAQKYEDILKELNGEKEINKKLEDKIDELNKMNADLENGVSVLQSQLNGSLTEKNSFEAKMENLNAELNNIQCERDNLEFKLNRVKEEFQVERETLLQELETKLCQEQRECYELKIRLQELSQSLNESLATQDSVTSHQQFLEVKLKSTEDELGNVRNERESLVLELSCVSSREDEQRTKIQDLECVLNSLKETLNKLESKQQDDNERDNQQKTQAQVDLLEKQLRNNQDSAAVDKEKLHITEDKLRKAGREVSDLKLDLRSAQREFKQCQETNQYLREKSKELKDQLKEKENEIQKYEIEKNECEERLRKKDSEMMTVQKKLEDAQGEIQSLLKKYEGKEKEQEESLSKLGGVQGKIQTLQMEYDRIKIEKRGLENEIKMLEREREKTKDVECSLKNNSQELESKLENAKSVINSLKEICAEQDDQLSIVDRFEERMEVVSREKEALNSEIQRLHSDLKMSKASTNEEKSLRLFQEKKVKDLENKLVVVDEDHEGQRISLENEIALLKEENVEIQSQIIDLENEFRSVNSRVRTLEHERLELQSQVDLLKKEILGHIEHIHSLKDSNFKLTDGLEQAITKGEMYKNSIEELERNLEELRAVMDDKELKLKSTVGQQIKLIDFLQAKIEIPPKKKATLSRMFRSSHKESSSYMVGHQYRKLEEMLDREKAHTQQLSTQLSKAREEVVALKAQVTESSGAQKHKKVLEDLTNSPTKYQNHPKERMRHKIPHRWQSYLVMRAGRCGGCLGSVPFSRNAVKCQECSLIAHTKCSKDIAKTCGLPEAFADHYTQNQAKRSSTKDLGNPSKKGWVKIPRSGKASWEKRFASLTKTSLCFYDQEPVQSLKPIKIILLSPKINILHSLPMSELPGCSVTDLPYVLKIDFKNENLDGGSSPVYMMASSFEEKQSWVSALETISQENESESENEDETTKGTLEMKTLISLNSVTPLDVNTVVFLDSKTVIVGAVEGLFSFGKDENGKLKFRARIEGISSIYEILLIESAGVVVFIGGKDNNLYHANLELLKVAAGVSQMGKPSISPVAIEPQISCHLVSASQHTKRMFMCAAAANRISIFLWITDKQTFEVCRQYSTQDPCSCFQFTPSSLIVGAERFYKINLKNFSIDEYLDESDTSLAYAIYGSAQMSSFPVAIIQVSGSGKHEEYLLVFYEFGIFVDACGRRSREFDLKFARLPVGIVFRPPSLYIIHHNSVEVLEIRPESFTKIKGMSFDSDTECAPIVRSASKMLTSPRYLGNGCESNSLLLATALEKQLEIISLRATFPINPDLSMTWSINSSQTHNLGDTSETSSISSEVSTLSDSTSSSLKRTKFPNFMRASKRTKKHQSK